MAVRFDHFGKTGRVETKQKPVSVNHVNKGPSNPNVFQILLNKLGLKDNTTSQKDLRTSPPFSKVIKSDHHVLSKGNVLSKDNGAIRRHSPEGVNNLAASALIAMTALSSGPNRISGLCSPGRYAQPGGYTNSTAGFAPVSETKAEPGLGGKIGALSARFESGESGPRVIGYDPRGGTCYGTYQISSRAGTMKQFMDYLSEKAPDLASELKGAGPANTGGTSGKMPEVWKKIATEDPSRFSRLQYDFIEKTHYLPALQEISARTGTDISKTPRALQEVLWSTAVQHGPAGAAKIFSKALEQSRSTNGGVQTAQLIDSVYNIRAGQFRSSEPQIVGAVRNRFKEEQRIAREMLMNTPYANNFGVRA